MPQRAPVAKLRGVHPDRFSSKTILRQRDIDWQSILTRLGECQSTKADYEAIATRFASRQSPCVLATFADAMMLCSTNAAVDRLNAMALRQYNQPVLYRRLVGKDMSVTGVTHGIKPSNPVQPNLEDQDFRHKLIEAYPVQIPTATGTLTEYQKVCACTYGGRLRPFGFAEYCKKLMQVGNGRFASHPCLPFLMRGLEQQHRAASSSSWAFSLQLTDMQAATWSDLQQRLSCMTTVDFKTYAASLSQEEYANLLKNLKRLGSDVKGSPAFWQKARGFQRSVITQLKMPALFVTLTLADDHDHLLHDLIKTQESNPFLQGLAQKEVDEIKRRNQNPRLLRRVSDIH